MAREGRASVVATAQGQMGRVRRTGRDLAFNMATRKRNAPCGAKDDVRPIEPRALSVPSAARAAGISRSMLYKLAAAGKGPRTRKIGARTVILTSDLDTWLAAQEVAP